MSIRTRKNNLAQIINAISERKRERIAKLALEFGYSYKYFKYSIVPELMTMAPCIKYNLSLIHI